VGRDAVFRRPRSLHRTNQASGCKIICRVQTLAQAKEAAAAGADVIIAQGRDAGGHSGTTRGTMGLVPAVVDAVAPIPVVAAGGIADGRGLAAALALGAAGISMGTRFTASRESLWDQAMKDTALSAGGDQTAERAEPAWPPAVDSAAPTITDEEGAIGR
jgi:nitronate monooxygenase